MAIVARVPPSRLYYYTKEGMEFKVWVTLRAIRVERWIGHVKKFFLDDAPSKVVGLDCEFTDSVRGGDRYLPPEQKQRAAVVQLSVASETLVFQICRADRVPQALLDFFADETIKFYGVALHNDLRMLRPYGISIASPVDLQLDGRNPTDNPTPSLYALSNAIIGTNLQKKKKEKKDKKKGLPEKKKQKRFNDDDEEDEEDLRFRGWGNVPLSFPRILYAALDARLGYEIALRWDT